MSETKGKDASGTFDPDVPGSTAHTAEDVYPVADEVTIYPEPGKETETAQALLEAAEDPRDVQFYDGAFVVSAELAKKAKVPEGTPTGPVLSQSQQDATLKAPAKAPAKKAADKSEPGSSPAAKKAPAKKAPAKSAAPKADTTE